MPDLLPPVFTTEDLRRLAGERPRSGCPDCAGLKAPGWEAIPGTFDTDLLHRIGTLRQPGDEDPTLDEYHPLRTHAWSPDAPIAPRFFPYNRCDVWECGRCGRPFLRYTEYGGYYQEERIREVHAERIVDVQP